MGQPKQNSWPAKSIHQVNVDPLRMDIPLYPLVKNRVSEFEFCGMSAE